MLPSLLSVSPMENETMAENGKEINYMSEVKRALGEYTIIFNELLRYVRTYVHEFVDTDDHNNNSIILYLTYYDNNNDYDY